MPQNSHLIATKSPSCDVCVFDTSKLPMMAAPTDKSSPLIKLTGHTKEGYTTCHSTDSRHKLWAFLESCKTGISS